MEKRISRLKVFLMTIMSLVVMLTGMTFIHLDKQQAEENSPTVVFATTDDGSDIQLPEGLNYWNDLFSYSTDSVGGYVNYYIDGVKSSNYSSIISSLTELSLATNFFGGTPSRIYINNGAIFNKFPNLVRINLGENVMRAAVDNIFQGCDNLEKIYYNAPNCTRTKNDVDYTPFAGSYGNNCEIIIGSNVTTIPDSMFSGASSITKVTIPSSVTSLGKLAFACCTSLEEVNYNGNVVNDGYGINGEYPFDASGVSAGAVINIGPAVPMIPGSMFYGAKISEINFDENSNLTTIGSYAFAHYSSDDNKVTSINIPDSVTSIGNTAFWNNSSLQEVILGKGLQTIGYNVFQSCSAITTITYNCTTTTALDLTEAFEDVTEDIHLTIGADVTVMPTFYTEGSTSGIQVKTLTLAEGWETIPEGFLCSDNVSPYDTSQANKILETINIPTTVSRIEARAFGSNESLRNVNFVDGGDVPLIICGYAFSGCSSLTTFTFPERFSGIEGYSIFWYTPIEEVFFNAVQCNDALESASLSWDDAGHPTVSSVNIGENVTRIPARFFKYSAVESITIHPDNDCLSEIGFSAFEECDSLTEFTIPPTVTTIGDSAFKGTGLQSITIPSSVTSLGKLAFANCTSLEEVNYNGNVVNDGYGVNGEYPFSGSGVSTGAVINIGPAVPMIPGSMFCGAKISEINFDQNSTLTSIDNMAFADTYYGTSLDIPDSVTSIGSEAFRYSTLQEVILGKGLQTIGSYAFQRCSAITSITYNCTTTTAFDLISIFSDIPMTDSNPLTLTIGKDVTVMPNMCSEDSEKGYYNLVFESGRTEIPDNACSVTNVLSVVIPNTVTKIGKYAFSSTSHLYEIDIPSSVRTIDRLAFDNSGIDSITLHDGLETISDSAFSGCYHLESITIPSTVTFIGDDAFVGCYMLTQINFNATNCETGGLTYPFYENGRDTDGVTINIASNVTRLAQGLFKEVYATTVNFLGESQCETIEYDALAGLAITELIIPDSVKTISANAFQDCQKLKNVVLGAGLKTMMYDGSGAFNNCSAITSITYNCTTTTALDLTEAFEDITGDIHLVIGSGVTVMPKYYSQGSNDGIQVTEITFNCANIPNNACYENDIVEVVNIANTVLTVGENAFYWTYSLTEINIPEDSQLSTIYGQAFSYTGITEITIPETVTSIGNGVLWGSKKLETVYFNAINCADTPDQYWESDDGEYIVIIGPKVERIPGNLFAGSKVSAVNINSANDCLTEIGDNAFEDCTSLTTFSWSDIEDSLTTIGASAFKGCTALTSVTITENIETIGKSAFENCSAVTSIYYNATSLDSAGSNLGAEIPGGGFHTFGSDSGCTVYVGENVTIIADYMFMGSNISSVEFADKNNCKTIGFYSFGECEFLSSITIPEGVTTIEDWAFGTAYYNLNSIILPNSLRSIGECAFWGTAIESITIPESVTSLANNAFVSCYKLDELNFNAINCNDMAADNGLYQWQNNTTTSITINIGPNVSRIPAYAFASFSWNNVEESIGLISAVNFLGDKCTEIGDFAFNSCIESGVVIYLPSSVVSIGTGAFSGNFTNHDTDYLDIVIDGYVTDGPRIAIPQLESATSLGVRNLFVPWKDMSLYRAGDYYTNTDCVFALYPYDYNVTFKYNDNVTDDFVEYVGENLEYHYIDNPTRTGYTFGGWYLDEDLTIDANLNPDNDQIYFSQYDFEGPTTVYAKWIYDGADWSDLYTYDFDGNDEYLTGLNETAARGVVDFVIPAIGGSGNGVYTKEIKSNAFSGRNIQSLSFEEGCQIQTIGVLAFNNSNLKTLDLSNLSIVTIDSSAFEYCNIQGELIIPNSVTRIGMDSFRGNEITAFSGLDNDSYKTENGFIYSADYSTLIQAPNIIEGGGHVVINSQTTTIGFRAFWGCRGIKSIFGENVTIIESEAFYSSDIEYFDFPNLQTIKSSALNGCNLKTIQLSTSVISIESGAFGGNDNLSAIVIGGSLETTRIAIPTIPTDENSLADNESDITVYVAIDDLDEYKASNWNRFNLVGIDLDSVAVRKVTIDLDGGSGYSNIYYIIHGETIDLSINPTKLGYSFVKWERFDGSEWVGYDAMTPVTADISIRANWRLIEYKINYFVNEGTIDSNTQTFNITDFGSDYLTTVAVKTPTRDGYTFVGWYTKSDFDSAKVTVIKFDDMSYNQLMGLTDINLYAKWEIVTYTMVFEETTQYIIGLDATTLNPVPWHSNFGFSIVFNEGYTQNDSSNIQVKLYDETGTTYISTVTATPNGNTSLHYVITIVDRTYMIKVEGIELNTYSVYLILPELKTNIFLDDENEEVPTVIQINHGDNFYNYNSTVISLHAQGYEFDGWHLRIQDGESEKIDANVYNMNAPVYSDITLVAKFTPELYSFNLDPNGSYVNGVYYEDPFEYRKFTIEDIVIFPTNVVKTGYTFKAWCLSPYYNEETGLYECDHGCENNTIGVGNYDITYYAVFTKDTYLISFVFNGGYYGSNYKTEYTVTDETFSLVTPIRDGYTFAGWYTDSTLTYNRLDAIEAGSTGNLTLYAKWEIIKYSITYNLNGNTLTPVKIDGAIIDANINQKVYNMEYSESPVDLQPVTRPGYTFQGWYDNADFTGDQIIEISARQISDISLYAKWQANHYEIIYDIGNWGIIPGYEVNAEYKIALYTNELEEMGGNYALPIAERVGWTFHGWLDTNSNTIITEINLSNMDNLNGKTLYAQFEQNTFTVTVIEVLLPGEGDFTDSRFGLFSVAGNLITSVSEIGFLEFEVKNLHEQYSQCLGELKISYSYAEDGEYTVLGIGTNFTIDQVTGDIFIKIENIRVNRYRIDFVTNGGSSVNPITDIPYNVVFSERPEETTRQGYTFAGWYYDNNTFTNEYDFSYTPVIYMDTVLYAKWDKVPYAITLTNNVNSDSKTIDFDVENIDSISLISNNFTIKGYEFKGFYLVPEGVEASEYSFSDGDLIENISGVYRNADVVARFEIITYKIYYGIDAGINDSNNPTEYTVNSDTITLAPASKTGYNFIAWKDADTDEIVKTIATGSVGNIYLVATFQLQSAEYVAVKYYAKGEFYTERAVKIGESINNTPSADPEIKVIPGFEFKGWFTTSNFAEGSQLDTTVELQYSITVYGKYDLISYTITYDANVPEFTNPSTNLTTINIESDFNLADGIKAGYKFEGWYENVTISEGVYDFTNATKVTRIINQSSNMSLVAKFSIIEYTIHYNLNNGQVDSLLAETYTVNTDTITLPTPTKAGYNFSNWTTGAGIVITEIANGSTGNYTLTANFTPITYFVTYIDDKTKTEGNPDSYIVETTAVVLTHNDVLGYRFLGWFDQSNKKVEVIGGGELGDITLTAKYEIIEYSISYVLNGGVMQNPNPSEYTIEQSIDRFLSPSKLGATFLHWKNIYTGQEISSIAIGSYGNLVLEAVFEDIIAEEFFVITYYVDGKKFLLDSVESDTKVHDVVSPTKDYYVFEGWYSDQSFTNRVDTNTIVTADMSLYARFTPINYKITYEFVDANGTPLNEVTNSNNNWFNIENPVEFVSPSKLGYTFIRFRIGNKTVTSTFGVYENIEVTGQFDVTRYTISYILNGGTSRNPDSYTILDRFIPLVDAVKEGYDFVGWFDSETNMKVTVLDAMALKNYTLIAKWKDPNAVASTEKDDNNNTGTIIAIAIIGSILVFATIGIVLMIKMKHNTVTIKEDKSIPNIQDINTVYNMEKRKPYTIPEEKKRNHESSLETRDETKEIGKFLGGMNEKTDDFNNHATTPHNIPTNDSQDNSKDENNNNGQ